jgi:uncharacterized protein YidB (DUF937 family)
LSAPRALRDNRGAHLSCTNRPISAEQLSQAFGNSAVLGQLAGKLGMSPQELSAKLSQVLPAAIDKLTPGGKLPP